MHSTTKTAFIKLPVYWSNPPLPCNSMQKRETYWAPDSTERVRPWSRSFCDKGPGAQGASTHPQARRRAREGGGLGPGAWGLCVGGVRGTQRALREGTANIIYYKNGIATFVLPLCCVVSALYSQASGVVTERKNAQFKWFTKKDVGLLKLKLKQSC